MKTYIAYHIKDNDGKATWTPIGKAFINRDNSINVFLNLLPWNGKFQLREITENTNRKTSYRRRFFLVNSPSKGKETR